MEKSGGMSDAQIKLFGKTIQLGKPINTHFVSAFSDDCELKKQNLFSHEIAISSCSASAAVPHWNRDGDLQEHGKKRSESRITETRKANDSSIPISEEFKDPTTLLENPRIPPIETEPDSKIDIKNSQQSENNSENTPRKPDKILPCQRCKSMDTKFCYYNNYNISQPRHFCKKCQRYWTAGGTMRNVPVGSGRRKNKKKAFASHCRHIMVSEALQATQANGRVLSFDSSFGEKSWKCSEDGYYGPEKEHFSPCGGGENGDDHSSKSSITAADSAESGGKGNSAFSESVWSNFQTLPGPPWHFPWNFSVTLHQKPSYWGSILPGSWNFPCLSPSNEGFKTLGKLSTDGEMLRNSEEKPLTENYVWNPKTLRIDDPYEAATSSTWSTLGSKNERNDLIKEKGLFKAFESKENVKVETAKTNLVLQANPAALCRLLNFHENA